MRTTLYAKIIPWFFISLLVLAAVFVLLFRIDFRMQQGSPFQSAGGDRMINLAWQISSDLSRTPQPGWNAVLHEYSVKHDISIYLFDPEGRQLAGTPVTLPRAVQKALQRPFSRPGHHQRRPEKGLRSVPDRPPKQPDENPRFSVHSDNPSRYWVGVRAPVMMGPGPTRPAVFLAASDSITGHGLFWDPVPWFFALGLFAVLGIALWVPVIRTITRPLGRITRATEAMAKGHFEVQLDERRSDEIGNLAVSINEMAKRLNGYLTGQRRFLADISHELSSPIARAKLALSIAEPETGGKAQKRIRNALGELENMSDLVNKLLALTRTEVGPQKIRLIPVDMLETARRAVEEENIGDTDIRIDMRPDITALADPELLSRALVNLVRNAVNYAGTAGPIVISAQQSGDSITIEVCDQGPGVPEMELDYIFEPFYRAEASRSRKTGGVGLGLAVVKSCTEACKGKVSATNRSPKGFCVTISLPAEIPQ